MIHISHDIGDKIDKLLWEGARRGRKFPFKGSFEYRKERNSCKLLCCMKAYEIVIGSLYLELGKF